MPGEVCTSTLKEVVLAHQAVGKVAHPIFVAVDEWALSYEIAVGTLSCVSARDLLLSLLVESIDERGVLGLEVDDEAILWVRPVLRNAGEGEGDLISEGGGDSLKVEAVSLELAK